MRSIEEILKDAEKMLGLLQPYQHKGGYAMATDCHSLITEMSEKLKDREWMPIMCAPRGVELLGATKRGQIYTFELDEERSQLIFGFSQADPKCPSITSWTWLPTPPEANND